MIDKLRECKKKCPLCGQTAWIKEVHLVNEDMASLFCSCGFHIERSGSIGTMEKIIKLLLSKWNTRSEPKHETVEQWEKRTGETYPDDGPVWEYDEWSSCRLSTHKEASKRIRLYGVGHEIVANHHGKPESV